MSIIRCIYTQQPSYPATDQSPDAVRYQVGALWVDAINGPPTQAEIDAVFQMDATGLAFKQRLSTDESERTTCKLDTAIMSLVNQTRAAWRTWAAGNFPSLTAPEQTRIGDLFWVVAVSVRRLVRNGS